MPPRLGHPTTASVPRPRERHAAAALAVLASVALTLWVQRRTLGGFFGPDDFIYLERARGLLPPLDLLWRAIPGRLWFTALLPLFGADPRAWLAANLVLHAVNVVLLYVLVRRAGAGPAAGFAAAALFGVSRLHVTALGQAATVSELLAAALTMIALILAQRPGRIAWIAAALVFAAALLCKESVALMPLVLLLDPDRPLKARAMRALPMCGIGVGWSVWLAASGAKAMYAGGAYDLKLGVNVWHNLMTFAEWCVDLSQPVPDLFGTWSPTAWKVGLVALGTALAFAALAWRRTRIPAIGLLWWGLALVPVLPLLYHSYLHYLYLPFAGAAMLVGGAIEIIAGGSPARGRAPRAALAWIAAGVAVIAYATASDGLIAQRWSQRLPDMDLPIDPFLRKVEYARRTAQGIAPAVREGRSRIAFLVPPGGGRVFEDVIRQTLDDGRGLRFLYPTLDSVAYRDHWISAGGFEIFAQSSEGRVMRLGSGAQAARRWAALLVQNGMSDEAARVLRRNSP